MRFRCDRSRGYDPSVIDDHWLMVTSRVVGSQSYKQAPSCEGNFTSDASVLGKDCYSRCRLRDKLFFFRPPTSTSNSIFDVTRRLTAAVLRFYIVSGRSPLRSRASSFPFTYMNAARLGVCGGEGGTEIKSFWLRNVRVSLSLVK